MAMYYYASKISAIACGTRCKQTVLQKSRGQRDRDKYHDDEEQQQQQQQDEADAVAAHAARQQAAYDNGGNGVCDGGIYAGYAADIAANGAAEATAPATSTTTALSLADGIRFRRRYSEQLDAYDIELGFQKLEVSTAKSTKTTFTGFGIGSANLDGEIVQYDIPKNTHKRSHCDVNYESSVLGSGGIMYINGRIVSGPLDSLVEVLVPKNLIDFDKEFIFSFLLSSRLFLRPHELLGKLLSSVPDSESLESLVALLAEWTNKFPYDYRDERMMSHVKHIVARCSSTRLEAVVSEILSALLKRLTDLERHEQDLRACQTASDKPETTFLDCPTASQYAQILCRLEKKLAKHIGPEEFLQCSSNVLLDKQKKWDQPTAAGGPPGAQDPKKTCNLETYLDWSARLRLFVCNEILQCSGIRDRSKTVELWSGVAQYCLLVGNYNSATAILETLESPPIARLKITWSKLQVTCQQLDCMQRHAEGHGDLWQKQAIVLNENHHKAETTMKTGTGTRTTTTATTAAVVLLSSASSSSTATTATVATTDTDTTATVAAAAATAAGSTAATTISDVNAVEAAAEATAASAEATSATGTGAAGCGNTNSSNKNISSSSSSNVCNKKSSNSSATKPNDWVVIPVFADIVKLALAGREDCLQRLPNAHLNMPAFDRMAAIVGAFTKHMHGVKSAAEAPLGEYEMFCRHMQKTSTLNESELMMASFDCEEPNNAEKLMYDLN